jgi:hypothetical protein
VGAECGDGRVCVVTEKNAKIAKVHAIAWCLRMKTLLKLNCFQNFVKRAKAKLSIPIKNFVNISIRRIARAH